MTATATGIGASTDSLWAATHKRPSYPTLSSDTHADVCVVGAGIAGLSTAYLLTQAGKTVCVLDDGDLGGGMTQMTTAHLSNAIDDRYFEMERLHGLRGAGLAAESHTAAIELIAGVVATEAIDCDLQRLDGYLFLYPGEADDVLDRELEAARRAGLSVEKLTRVPGGVLTTGGCLRFPDQGQFHPLKYLSGLARAIEREGGRIFTRTHADRIEGGAPARITAGRHTVTADAVVVATNTPVNDRLAIHTKQAPYMTYVVGMRVPRGSVPQALYWDTHDPYHYVRTHSVADGETNNGGAHDILIVGGEDHKTGQANDALERYGRLEAWAREHFPIVEDVAFQWAGQVMETIDGLAFIGRNPLDHDNVYVATGDSGMGMTHGTIAGMLISDLILGRPNQWADLYEPTRKTLRAAGEFTRETLNMAAQYADWLTSGDVRSVDDIPNNSGAVIRRGLSKVACYRDEQGVLHERSAVCTHLGCIVAWNAAERSWDCPCHGSRFDRFGDVVVGPANRALARKSIEQQPE